MARPKLSEDVGCLIVSPEDMVEFETIKFLLQLPDLLSICNHARVMTVQLSHELIDDEFRVSTDVKPLHSKFSGDV
jgi:hypothetical protein